MVFGVTGWSNQGKVKSQQVNWEG